MKRGNKRKDDGIQMPSRIATGCSSDGDYKYLRVLESDKAKMKKMLKVRQNYV